MREGLMSKLEDKVVFVTGGAGLIGNAFCHSIVESGGIPIVADICLQSAEKLVRELPRGHAVKIDITDKESISSAIKEVENKYGRVDALVNNAYPRNKNYGQAFFDVNYSDFSENISMNLGGYFLCSQIFANYFIKNKTSGNIINISSIYGFIAPRFEVYDGTEMTMPVEYAAIKSGIIHLTKYMAKFLKGANIKVNCLSPGGIENGQDSRFLKRYKDYCLNKGMLDADDLTGGLLFLLSDDSQFINGQNLIIDDGFSL
jgi:NAD(P)-dependent dehydrogenase (short-subunit alcohol dehydrogenase family)